jgi:hypothetical protein
MHCYETEIRRAIHTPGFDAYPYGLNWFLSYPSNRFSNILYDAPAGAGSAGESSAMLADMKASAVEDSQSVPEPGTLTYLASAVLC